MPAPWSLWGSPKLLVFDASDPRGTMRQVVLALAASDMVIDGDPGSPEPSPKDFIGAELSWVGSLGYPSPLVPRETSRDTPCT